MADVNFSYPQCGRSLQADARSTGTQVQCPQCGGTVVVPPGGAPSGGPQASSARPTLVTIFGILSILFGSLGLLCTARAMVGTSASFEVLDPSPGYEVWIGVSSLIGLALAAWLLDIGIGLLRLKRWARSGALGYAWLAITFDIVRVLVGIVALVFGGVSPPPGALPTYIAGLFLGLLALIYPVLLLMFMSKPHVIAACSR